MEFWKKLCQVSVTQLKRVSFNSMSAGRMSVTVMGKAEGNMCQRWIKLHFAIWMFFESVMDIRENQTWPEVKTLLIRCYQLHDDKLFIALSPPCFVTFSLHFHSYQIRMLANWDSWSVLHSESEIKKLISIVITYWID